MMQSMTGFGQARREIEGCHYTVEIRSVNDRYYKSLIRLPEIRSFMEPEIDQSLRGGLHRGSVNFMLRMKAISAEAAYEVNTAAMERYIEHLETIRPDQTDITLSVDLASLLQLPGVCSPPEPEQLCRKARPALMGLIAEAIDGLQEMRTEEGKALHAQYQAERAANFNKLSFRLALTDIKTVIGHCREPEARRAFRALRLQADLLAGHTEDG